MRARRKPTPVTPVRTRGAKAAHSAPIALATADERAWSNLASRERGIVYIATGRMYVAAAARSALAVRRHCPGLPVVLFTDLGRQRTECATDLEPFDAVHDIVSPHRRSKLDYLPLTPFERTLYIDSDVRPRADVSDIFELLAAFDLALAHAHARNRGDTNVRWRIELPAAFPQFNGGVIAYRRTEAVLAFLREWRDSYHSNDFGKDQVTLRELLWLSGLRIATLPPEYNVRYLKYLWVWRRDEAQAKMLHLHSYHSLMRRRLRLEALLAPLLSSRPIAALLDRLRKPAGSAPRRREA